MLERKLRPVKTPHVHCDCIDQPGKRTIIFTVPAPTKLMNSNDRLHRMAQNNATKLWRTAAGWQYRRVAQGLKLTPPVAITARVFKAHPGRYDAGNFYPTVKAIVDGCVDAGMVPDDSNEYVAGPFMLPGGYGMDAIQITVTEIDPLEEAS